MAVNHNAKVWNCSRCGKRGNHGRRKVGLTTYYRQPQCVGCRSRYRKTETKTPAELSLLELRMIYTARYPKDKAGLKRSRKFIIDKLTRKGVEIEVLTIS